LALQSNLILLQTEARGCGHFEGISSRLGLVRLMADAPIVVPVRCGEFA
jgi:hypothetical protein